jgi:hypothetical protein
LSINSFSQLRQFLVVINYLRYWMMLATKGLLRMLPTSEYQLAYFALTESLLFIL